MARKKRTKQESRAFKAKIARLKKRGRSGSEIARELGVKKQYVSLVLTQAGLADGRRRSVPRKPKDFSAEVIANNIPARAARKIAFVRNAADYT